MHDESAQESFIRETLARAISEEEMPSLPDLSSGQILIMIEAKERVDDAVNILNRHHAVTAGVVDSHFKCNRSRIKTSAGVLYLRHIRGVIIQTNERQQALIRKCRQIGFPRQA